MWEEEEGSRTGSRADRRQSPRAAEEKGGQESQGKRISKTRHFPNDKRNCRVALRGARVTLSAWATGMRATGSDATKMPGIQSLLRSAQPDRKLGRGCLCQTGHCRHSQSA